MSILNAYVGRDCAWMAVDTEGVVLGNTVETFACQKMILLQHKACVIGGRGRGVFLPLVYLQIAQHPELAGFDELAGVMPELLTIAYADMARSAAATDARPGYELQQISLIGWSGRRMRFAGVSCEQLDACEGFATTSISQYFTSPAVQLTEHLNDAAAMIELAQRQIRLIAQNDPDHQHAGGGRYQVAHLTRDAVHVETLATLVRPVENEERTTHDYCCPS